jgi:hypothetical protein
VPFAKTYQLYHRIGSIRCCFIEAGSSPFKKFADLDAIWELLAQRSLIARDRRPVGLMRLVLALLGKCPVPGQRAVPAA